MTFYLAHGTNIRVETNAQNHNDGRAQFLGVNGVSPVKLPSRVFVWLPLKLLSEELNACSHIIKDNSFKRLINIY